MRYWTLDDLSRGHGMTADMIKKCVKGASARKSEHRASWQGWTRNRHMRSEVSMPVWLYLQPAFQKEFFPEEADEHERVKALERLKSDSRFRSFVTHD
mgnify:FL=1